MESLINIVILILLMVVAIAIARMQDLFAITMLLSIYGLLSASLFVIMDAVDVAFTEAAVGAGISTLLMLVVLSMTGRSENSARHKPLYALIVVVTTGAFLLYATSDAPFFGSMDSPIHHHVAPRYINDSMQEVGVANIVTSVLASYRAFDTFGEVVVVFTAGISVLALLSTDPFSNGNSGTTSTAEMHEQHLIIRIVTKILFPFILLFALYVQFHGDFGPGGGFQAGVIFAAAIILYTMVFGLKSAMNFITPSVIQLIAATGVLLYGSVGLVTLLSGGNFFDYDVLSNDPITGQHMGIALIEWGVGCTVASVMIIIFYSFCARREVLQRKNKLHRDKE